MPKIKEFLKNVGLLCASVFFCLILFEAGSRILSLEPLPDIPADLYMNDDDLGYKFARDASVETVSKDQIKVRVETNSLGFWEEDEPPYDKPVIMVLGDSFTHGSYCCGLEDTYPKVLERALSKEGRDYKVINAGVPGYSPKNELSMLKKYYDILHPKVAVMTFYIDNDLYDMQDPYRYKVVDGQLVNAANYLEKTSNPQKRIIYDAKEFLIRNSEGYRVLKSFMDNRINAAQSETHRSLLFYEKDANVTKKNESDAAKAEFLSFKAFCEEKGIKCMVYIIPGKISVFKNNKDIAKTYGITGEMDYLWIQREFSGFFSANNISDADLTAEFLKLEKPEDMYLPRDIHWTKEGTNIAGEYLAQNMIKRGIV
jgi:hypothetical protein